MSLSLPAPLWPGSHLTWEVLDAPVTALAPDEVFVFGSNARGFHGAGAAGAALRGDAGREWASDAAFAAMRNAPVGSDGRWGLWAVYGVARGHQAGHAGQSYAIETVAYPGEREPADPRHVRRVMNDIYCQLRDLVAFAEDRPELRFLVTRLGVGHSWVGEQRMAAIWREVHARAPTGLPKSFRFVWPKGS